MIALSEQRIWLMYVSPKDSFSVEPGPLEYFRTHFAARPMRDSWLAPALGFAARSRTPKDFVPWMASAPVVSDRARQALEGISGPGVEFLPLFEMRGSQFYALNVLNETDKLDSTRSEIEYFDDEKSQIMMLKSVAFDFKGSEAPPIFKIKGYSGEIFVSHEFALTVKRASLTGVMFLDPARDVLDRVLSGTLTDDFSGCLAG